MAISIPSGKNALISLIVVIFIKFCVTYCTKCITQIHINHKDSVGMKCHSKFSGDKTELMRLSGISQSWIYFGGVSK